MSHTALARKYRPLSFSEVATQEHVSDTLRRAVSTGRVGHAYLFSGPRGVGKTTLARVLAMALNCPNRGDDGEPCGHCDDCTRIWSGSTSLDVVEIDAASNRGVDDARDLRERAMYAPSDQGRHKVYIVDEAHMLTREAWNALLKVLEEPPPRVHFVFATTEPQKIEQTAAPILSRCQRFDFRRVGVSDMVERVREVLAREGVEATEEALRLVARKADGGMRDALSLTDQVLALSEGAVSADTVRRILGVVGDDHLLHLFDVLAARDRAGVFTFVQELLDQGFDLVEFYHGMVEGLRTLLQLRVGADAAEVAEERREDWEARAGHFDPADLLRMLVMAAELEVNGSLRRTQQPRILLELLLLRFAWLDETVTLEAVIRALGGEGPPPEPASRRPTPLPAPPRPTPATPPTAAAPSSAPPAAEQGSVHAPAPSARAAPAAGIALPAPAARAPAPTSPPVPAPLPPSAPAPSPTQDAAPPPAPPTGPEPAPGPPAPDPLPEPSGAPGDPERRSPPPAASPSEPPSLLEAWNDVVHTGDGLPPGLSPFLLGARVEAGEDGLLVHLPEGLALDRLRSPEIRESVREALRKRTGQTESLSFLALTEATSEGDAARRISSSEVREGRLHDLLQQEPGLGAAVESLDLQILDG